MWAVVLGGWILGLGFGWVCLDWVCAMTVWGRLLSCGFLYWWIDWCNIDWFDLCWWFCDFWFCLFVGLD